MDKESILDYLDKGRKGYISLCDLGRIIIDGIVWILLLIIFSSPGIIITKPDQIYSIHLVINIVIGIIAVIVYTAGLFILMAIIGMCYNKLRCKIKLIKLK